MARYGVVKIAGVLSEQKDIIMNAKGLFCEGCGKEVSEVAMYIGVSELKKLCIPCYKKRKLEEKK